MNQDIEMADGVNEPEEAIISEEELNRQAEAEQEYPAEEEQEGKDGHNEETVTE